MKKLTINSIDCKKSTNLPGDDDVFIMAQVDGGPPIRYPILGTMEMDDGDSITFPYGDENGKPVYYYQHALTLTIWDHDGPANFINEADFLGTMVFQDDSDSDTYKLHGTDSADYHLDVTIADADPSAVANGQVIPADLQNAANQAVLGWAQTDEGKKALKESDPDDLNDLLSKGLADEIFDDVISLVRDIPVIKAVSLGLMGQVEVFGGIDGGFGVAMDLPSFPDKWAIYAGGGFVEGVDAGIQGTLALGFWFEDTSDIGGFYAGAEIDVDDGLGVTGIAWASKDDKDDFKTDDGVNLKYAKVIFIGIDVGIDDGVEAEELYVFAGHLEKYPSFQPGVYDNMAVITKIECEDQHSSDGFRDDVHFLWTVDDEDQEYRWPYWNDAEMDEDNIPEIKSGPVMKFNDSCHVKLYVTNSVDNTKKFSHSFDLDEFSGVGGTHSQTYEDGGTEYKIEAKLLVKS